MPCIFTKYQDIDLLRWDAAIASAKNGLPYAYSWYLNAVAEKWDALIWNDYEAIMPLPNDVKMGLRSVYNPFFAQQLGIFYQKELKQSIFDEFLKAIPAFHRIFTNLNTKNNFSSGHFNKRSYKNYILPLSPTHHEIVKNYSSNTRRNLKKAQKIEWSVKNISAESCIDLFKKTKGIGLGYPDHYYSNLAVLMQQSSEKKVGNIIGLLDKNGELHAAIFFLVSHNRIINLFPPSSDWGKKNGAMFLLLDHLIEKHANSQHILDFEGSMISGVERFYRGFGAQLEPYWRLEKEQIPWYMAFPIKIYKAIKQTDN